MAPRRIPVLVLLALLASGCAAPRPVVVAHRGASWDAPENTIAAFREAWRQGADAIEGDFRISADGVIVCVHDETTERTAGEALVVAETTFDELRGLDVGTWKDGAFAGERIPTLEEVLATVPEGGLVYIELKAGPEIIPPLVAVLEQSPVPRAQLLIISFEPEVVAAAAEALPDVRRLGISDITEDETGAWTPAVDEMIAVARDVRADGLTVRAVDVVDEAFAAAVRGAGLELHVWTVNDIKTSRRMGRVGVDSITTDRPDFVRRAMRDLYPRSTKPPLGGAYPFRCW
jgi:glycerophosphoryl diester phosphodiesterase